MTDGQPDPADSLADDAGTSAEISLPDFPDATDLTTTVRFAVVYRIAGSKIALQSGNGRLVGRLVTRLSELSASLMYGGSNPSVAASRVPVDLQRLEFGNSVDIQFVIREDPDLFKGEYETMSDDAAKRLTMLVGLAGDEVTGELAKVDGAILTSWRHTVELLSSEDCDLAVRTRTSDDDSLTAVMPARAARKQVAVLTEKRPARKEIYVVTGVLDELSSRRDSFEMISPKEVRKSSPRLHDSWTDALGGRQTIKGELSPEAKGQIRALNAWGELVDAQLEVTTLSTAAGKEELEIELRSIEAVHGTLT